MEHQNKTHLSVLIIAKNDPSIDWIQLSIQEQSFHLVGQVESTERALQKLKTAPDVNIILADSSGAGVLDTQWLRRLSIQFPDVLSLVLANHTEMDFVREAMIAGANGFLLKPFGLPELTKSIDQIYQLWLERHTFLTDKGKEGKSSKSSSTIAVFSRKGGTGVTTLAVNLAIAIKQQTAVPVLLIDADFGTPDIDIFLSLFRKTSILDLMGIDHPLDEGLLKDVTAEHVSGISVLPGDPQLQFVDAPFEPGRVGEVISEIIALWEGYIVINTGSNLDRWTIETLDQAETVLVVTSSELPALRVTRNFLDLAEAVEDEEGKWQVVMAGYKGLKEVQLDDIEDSIHYPITATIAKDDVLVSTSINRGTPIITSQPKSPITKDILNLAKQLIEAHPIYLPHLNLTGGQNSEISQEKAKRPERSKRRFAFW